MICACGHYTTLDPQHAQFVVDGLPCCEENCFQFHKEREDDDPDAVFAPDD